MSDYRVAVTMERALTVQETHQLGEVQPHHVHTYELDYDDVVIVTLAAADSVAAWKAAIDYAQAATEVPVLSFQVLP